MDRQCVPVNLHLQVFSVFDVGNGYSNRRHRMPTARFPAVDITVGEGGKDGTGSTSSEAVPLADAATTGEAVLPGDDSTPEEQVTSQPCRQRQTSASTSCRDRVPQQPQFNVVRAGGKHALVPVLDPLIQYHTVTWGAPCSHHDGFSKHGGGASLIHKLLRDVNSKLAAKNDEVHVQPFCLIAWLHSCCCWVRQCR